jgi:hypothetical protein
MEELHKQIMQFKKNWLARRTTIVPVNVYLPIPLNTNTGFSEGQYLSVW